MSSLPKKRRQNESLASICIRLCDSFKRTPQNFICSFIRAEESVRVFYKLQQEPLKNILYDAGTAVGLQFISITWCPGESKKCTIDGNIFIEYKSSAEIWDEDTFTKYKDFVKLKLQNVNIKYILVDQVMEKTILSQPIISEMDYKIYELDTKFQNCLCQYQNSAEPDTFSDDLENIKTLLQELKDRRIQIALLSHNAVGKSFILNLLLMLTAESNKNSKDEATMEMPEKIAGNPTVKMVKEGQFENLPEVIKDFIAEVNDDEQDFKNLFDPICHQLLFTDHEELERIESSFKSLSGYYTHHKRIDIEPYLLPQKEISRDYNATTNCVFYLRYGTTFQAKVEYFDEKELQNQLFELVSLEKGSAEMKPELVNEMMQQKAEQSLRTRFKILVKNAPRNCNEETLQDVLRAISSPGEIELCNQVKEFVGKTELYIGNGNNPVADRLALQKLLKDFALSAEDEGDEEDDVKNDEDNRSPIRKQKIASLKRLVVYVPSTLLYGGIEILEMPGTNDSDPLAMSFIQDALDEVEVVLLLSEYGFRLAGEEVKDCLTNSRFITHWKRDSNYYRLMFLSYPEKNNIYQLGAGDLQKLKKIMMTEEKKREEEIQSFKTLLYPTELTPEMHHNIFFSTLLPVLHSSILALEGDPHDNLANNKDFLNFSGIELLMKEFDRILIQKKKDTILEIEKQLEEFEAIQQVEANYVPNDVSEEDTQPGTQNIEFEHEREFLQKHEQFFNNIKDEIIAIITGAVDGRLKAILEKSSLNAVKKWVENKSNVTSTALFNPHHSGRHSSYKINIDKVLFEDLDKEISPVLKEVIENMEHVVADYKEKAITLIKEDVQNMAYGLEKKIENVLSSLFGVTRTSFNETTLMKSFENLSKENMRKHLLEPAYNNTIININKKMETYIYQVLSELQSSFLESTTSLYNERWPANLAQVMVRLCIPLNSIRSSQGCTFCGKINCKTCIYIEPTATFKSHRKNKVYPIKGKFTCTTKNVIYLITCKRCKMQYVGQTRKMMKERFAVHLSNIKCKPQMLLAKHFNLDGHDFPDVSLVIIEEVGNANTLAEREKHWIQELETLNPAGLNANT